MTKREAAIISAYTGILVGKFSDMHALIEEVLGRPVVTIQLPGLTEEIGAATKPLLIKISEELTD
jgi:hypothetical protein